MTLAELMQVASEIERRYRMTPRQVVEFLEEPRQLTIPLSVFADRRLGVMETVVKYLRENEGMQFRDIAQLLGRDSRVTWTTYDKAKKKALERISIRDVAHPVPVRIFAGRKFASLETLAKYCREQGMTNAEIAHALNRDLRTIWTVVNRR